MLIRKRYDVARILRMIDADAENCIVLSMLLCRLKGRSMILLVCAVIEEGGKKEDQESALNIPLR